MHSESTYVVIVNPAAGGGRAAMQCRAGVERLRGHGMQAEVVETKRAGHATEIAADFYRRGFRRFVSAGGDGTSFEIVNGLIPATSKEENAEGRDRPVLGFLPMGTGNSFLRDFTKDGAEYAVEALLAGKRRACDVMRLQHHEDTLYSLNLISLGFVADVNGRRQRQFRQWGEAGYVAAVVTEVAGLQATTFPMEVDGELDDKPLCFVSFNNSKFTGGKMMMAPDADPSDGLIDIIRAAPLSRFDLLRTFPKIFSGTHVHHRAVTSTKAREVVFMLEKVVDVMVDGEALQVQPERLDVLPGAIDVVA